MNYWLLVIYFFAGVISDFLFTINMRFIAKERAGWAALVSFITTIISMYVLYTILTEMSGKGLISIVVYALGIGAGTYIAMHLRLEK